MSNDIYRILQRFDSVAEGLSPNQERVKQLPALFRPKDTSPQLSGPYPGKNATLGYLVGEGEEDANPMARAVTRRIVNQHPEWITKYGVEALMQAIDDVTDGEEDFEEIGSSDISAYVQYVKDALDDRMGSREEMNNRKPFAEGDVISFNRAGYNVLQNKEDYLEKRDTLYRLLSQTGIDAETKKTAKERLADLELAARNAGVVKESATTEDVISTVKKKLGDYLSDLTKEIKKDPDLKDKLEKDIDQIGPAIKTIKTDDGHEIKIHGNEDDGFRITIKNKEMKTPFRSLDEAVMATEMYCARRKGAAAVNNSDYIDEA